MSFWSDKKFLSKQEELEIISSQQFKEERLEASSYELSIGERVYFSSKINGSRDVKLEELGDSVEIPKGHFAIISTEEKVKIPHDAMAFISVKAGFKMQGLVNVSGFHVDPGYDDHLRFGVFNSGTNDLTIHRGEAYFLLFIADLDNTTSDPYKSDVTASPRIPPKYKDKLKGEVLSVASLLGRVQKIERVKDVTFLIGGAILTVLVPFLVYWLSQSTIYREKVTRLDERINKSSMYEVRISKLEVENLNKIENLEKRLKDLENLSHEQK